MNSSGNWFKAVDKYLRPGQGKLKLISCSSSVDTRFALMAGQYFCLAGLILNNAPLSFILSIPVIKLLSQTNNISLCLGHNYWRLIQWDENNFAPTARSGSHSVHYNNSIYLFGGYTRKGGTYFNDMSQFDTLKAKWLQL